MSSFEFNAILLEISNQLTKDQLEKIKFLCKDVVGKREQENIDTGSKLFQSLTEKSKLGVDNKEYLCRLLQGIQRHDLSDKLKHFVGQPDSPNSQPDEKETAKLDLATEVITENLGKNWRKLGRKLGLTDVKLESISRRHPTELEETAMELLKEWRKNRGAEACTKELIKALRACQFNLTADKVETKLAPLGD